MIPKIHLINHENDKKISKKEEGKHTFPTSYQNKVTEIKIKGMVQVKKKKTEKWKRIEFKQNQVYVNWKIKCKNKWKFIYTYFLLPNF